MKKNISYVTENELCLSCGYCEPICPENAIEIKFNENKGFHEPIVNEAICNESGKCLSVCPGLAVDFPKLNKIRTGDIPEYHHIGNIKNTYILYSSDQDIRKKAASGGFITGLLKFLFEYKKIDGAVVVKNSYDQPFEPVGYIAKNFDDLRKSQMSIYHTVPMGKVMKKIRNFNGKLAFVGIPCQIHGLLNYIKIYPELKEKFFLLIGTFCGGYQSHFAHQYYFSRKSIDFKSIKSVDYRYGEFPGQFRLKLKNGSELELKRRFKNKKYSNEYNVAFNSSFYVPRCYLCADKGNILTDITAGDPWLPKFKDEKLGKSLVVSRTDLGEKLIEEASKCGFLIKEKASFSDVMDVQKLDRERHGNQLANMKVYKLFNKPYPEYRFLGKYGIYKKGIYVRVILDFLRPYIQRRKNLWFVLRPVYFMEKHFRNIFIYSNPIDYIKRKLNKGE